MLETMFSKPSKRTTDLQPLVYLRIGAAVTVTTTLLVISTVEVYVGTFLNVLGTTERVLVEVSTSVLVMMSSQISEVWAAAVASRPAAKAVVVNFMMISCVV